METKTGDPGPFSRFDLHRVPSPAFVADAARFRQNLSVLADIEAARRAASEQFDCDHEAEISRVGQRPQTLNESLRPLRISASLRETKKCRAFGQFCRCQSPSRQHFGQNSSICTSKEWGIAIRLVSESCFAQRRRVAQRSQRGFYAN